MKQPAVYIVTNKPYGTLYTGVTSDLIKRTHQHKTATTPSFATRHACTLLVWHELHPTMETAILREKQLKAGPRAQKLRLINTQNPTWRDQTPDLL